ncbi:acetate--CoA ligase family protein [Sulfitobacter sp. SK025]|uniref:acetate--CoA ligase family protein n=1 Tax=Sulfitobacter sp. SK025 TaxID=1389011 RepID=UPI0020C7677C|nr:acetate--CoA ligase family protein [Sulfitobacter sp. SK025]
MELIDTAEIRLAPAKPQTAESMVRSGPGARMLAGLRGAEPADRGGPGGPDFAHICFLRRKRRSDLGN